MYFLSSDIWYVWINTLLYYFQVGKVEKRRKIKTLLNHRKTMDRLGPMSHYLLRPSNRFPVQSWSTMQRDSKKMGNDVLHTNATPRALLPSLLCPLYPVFSYCFPCPLPSLFTTPPPFYCWHHLYIVSDKHNTAHTEDLESLAVKCLRSSAIMIMQPPFIILLVSLKASTHSPVN